MRMMGLKKELKVELFLPILFLAFFLIFYSFLLSPGVTGGDAGDLVAASALKGVPHPPGYPLYTLLGWFLNKLPIGPTPAWRVGLLSSLPSTFSVFLAFLIAKRISKNTLISLIASLSLAFNYLFWLQAEVQEVFALHVMFLFLTLYLVLLWLEKPRKKILYFLALITGLEFSHHHTYILIFPALFYFFIINKKSRLKRKFLNRKVILNSMLFLLVGALFYLYVPLASAGNPPVNWGQVRNFRSLVRLITRADYGTIAPAVGVKFSIKNGVLAILAFLDSFYQEFTLVGTILVILGLAYLYKIRKNLFNFSLIWFIFAGLFFQFYAGFPVQNWFILATKERFYLIIYPVFLLWLVFGLLYFKNLIEKITTNLEFPNQKMKSLLPLLVTSLMVFYPMMLLYFNIEKNDFRDFYEFDKYAERVQESCPPNSVLIPSGDAEVFSVFYSHFVAGIRPDLKIISMGNPREAVFRIEEFSQFRPLFTGSDQSCKDFWLDFKKFVSDQGWTVCTSEKINVNENYSSFPNGLVNIYSKEASAKDYDLIFERNVALWKDYTMPASVEVNPRFEAFFNLALLEAYYNRAFAISAFFFEARRYEEAEYWLHKSLEFRSGSESVIRADFLIDVMQKKCDSAREKLEKNREVFERAITWPMIKEVYEKECLLNGEDAEEEN